MKSDKLQQYAGMYHLYKFGNNKYSQNNTGHLYLYYNQNKSEVLIPFSWVDSC